MDDVKTALGPVALLAALAVAAAPVCIGGCAAGGAPSQEGGYQRKNGNADLALPPDLLPAADMAGAAGDLAGADLQGVPYDFATAPPPDMRIAPCTPGNCYRIIAYNALVPSKKADGMDWDGLPDLPDPYLRITLWNGATYRSPKQDNNDAPSWNHVLVDDMPLAELGKNIRFQFMEQDGLFNNDDTIVDFTKYFDANDIASGGFAWSIRDGWVQISVQKQ